MSVHPDLLFVTHSSRPVAHLRVAAGRPESVPQIHLVGAETSRNQMSDDVCETKSGDVCFILVDTDREMWHAACSGCFPGRADPARGSIGTYQSQ